MSPKQENCWLRNSAAHSQLPYPLRSQVGPDDIDELVQDAIATAAKLLHSVETRAKKSRRAISAIMRCALPARQAQHRVQKTDPLQPGPPR